MSRASIIVLFLFSVALFIALVTSTANAPHIAEMELTIAWLRQAMGSFLAIAAALAILVGALNGKQIEDLVVLVVALFAALTLITASWNLTLPLGLIVILILIKEVLGMLLAKGNENEQA